MDGDWYADVYLGDVESGKLVNVTRNPGNYLRPRFAADGRLLYFVANGDVGCIWLQGSVYSREEQRRNNAGNTSEFKPVKVDFDGIDKRMTLMTGFGTVTDVVASPSGSSLLYSTASGQVWSISVDHRQHDLLAGNLDRPSCLQFGASDRFVFFETGDGRLQSLDLDQRTLRNHPYFVELERDLTRERLHTFDQVWWSIREYIIEDAFIGSDWNTLYDRFQPRAAAARRIRDLADVVRQMLGELGVSHLEYWPQQASGRETGHLGIIPEYDHTGSGIKIERIIPGTPAASEAANIKLQEKIVAIEGENIKGNENCYLPLSGTIGRQVEVTLINRDGITRRVEMTPLDSRTYRELEYRDWVRMNRKLVEDISNGTVAYVHLRHFDQTSPDLLERDIARYGRGKSSLILDIRGNEGGKAHDRVLRLLSATRYIERVPRRGLPGADSKAVFSGEIILLVDERTRSDAEIFSHGFRLLQLGEIIGTRTYGAVLGAEVLTLVDGSKLRIPTVAWKTLTGAILEGKGVTPDIREPMNLTSLEKGDDSQLRSAVEHLVGRPGSR
jgi:C-terminal processing protease CtpA/Prc